MRVRITAANELKESEHEDEHVQRPQLHRSVAAAKSMSWEDLQVLFATTFVDEIAAAINGGGRQLLRNRLEGLSNDERRALGEELDALSV
jgi:hypothetical protein